MKKILSFLGTITLIGTITTSLVACDKTQEYTSEELAELKEKNKIDTTNQEIKDNLEWIAPKEKPFNEIGNNKYYFIVWKGLKSDKWTLKKYKDVGLAKDNTLIDTSYNNAKLHRVSHDLQTIAEREYSSWCTPFGFNYKDDGTHFKSVYRWNLYTQKPDLVLDDKGNIKVKDE
ncbi:lipoprotein [Spiroplasma endosymbiont of Polydrusus pterygomalis]|uniref:lipoprotein n=1 Tax=Spiroplasma endosymbiont of Polydrusus pterygomalis TaxID=3139327 RepID=UPI003CCB50C7